MVSVSAGIFFQGIAWIGGGLLIVYGCHRLRTSDRYVTWTINNIVPQPRSDLDRRRTAAVLRSTLALGMGFGTLIALIGVVIFVEA